MAIGDRDVLGDEIQFNRDLLRRGHPHFRKISLPSGGLSISGIPQFAPDLHLLDNEKIFFGTDDDASITWDGSDLLIDPDDANTNRGRLKMDTTSAIFNDGLAGNMTLEVKSTDGTTVISTINTDNFFGWFNSTGGGAALYRDVNAAQNSLRFGTAVTSAGGTFVEQMRITGDARVGINTNAPSGNLDVRGTGNSFMGCSNTGSFLELLCGNGLDAAIFWDRAEATDDDLRIGSATSQGGTGFTEAMRIFGDELDVSIGTQSNLAQLAVDQSATDGAQPVLKLDQGDVSEQCIMFSSDATDQDINLWTIEVTGAPVFSWDESENQIAIDRGMQFTPTLAIASASGAVWDGINVKAATASVTGTTQITTATGFNLVNIGRPTIADFSAVTIDHAATLYIANSPLAAISVTITNPYALWVDDGDVRIDGTITGPSGTWDSGGMDIAASDSYAVAGTDILADSAGTMTLSNVDALDATTETTIEAAIDTLANLTAASSLVTVGALNSGSIATGFGNIDNGSSSITTTGTIAGITASNLLDKAATETVGGTYTFSNKVTVTDDVLIDGKADTVQLTVLAHTVQSADLVVFQNAVTGDVVRFNDTGSLYLKEQVDALTDVAGQGQIWVNTATPNELFFTDDGGVDYRLGYKAALKTSDESIDADTTLQNDDDLLFAIAANETWMFEIQLFVTGVDAGDIKVDITSPSGATTVWYVLAMGLAETGTGSVAVLQSKVRTGASVIGVGTITNNTSSVLLRGTAANGATPGNIQLQWAQNTSNATATVVKANSTLIAHKIS